MSLTHVTAVRNSLAEVVRSAMAAGTGSNAKLIIKAGATTLVTFNLGTAPFGAAAAGVITLAGTPVAATASAGGTADSFVMQDRDGTQALSGSVTATGGGGDVTVTNTNIASGQDCQISSLTYTAPV